MIDSDYHEHAAIVDDGVELTIAICTYRRFGDLKDCLANLEHQTADRSRFRVLVIDNSLQPEQSARIRDELSFPFELEYVITPKNGIAYARNQAIRRCRTPYLGFIDDDVTVAPDWAEVLLDTFARHGGRAGCVSGKIKPKFECGTPPDWLKDELLWPLAVIDWGDEEKLLVGDSEWFVTASIGFDIRAVRQSGGFSEHLGRKGRILLAHEDLQIVTDLQRMGYGLVYNPNLRAEHFIPDEKTRQTWYCKDAFWQTVSRMVYASGNPFDLDGPLVTELTVAVDAEVERWKEQPDKQSVQQKLAEVSHLARTLMKRRGYDPHRLFPEPEFRTIFIVTPAFNAAETIDETITSVLSQEGAVFIRYHVQDGGSTDGTVERLQEWERRVLNNELPFELRCRGIHMTWSSEPDHGVYDAISRAVELLPMEAGDVMGWLNADDFFYDRALATVSEVFDLDHVQWVVGATSMMNMDGSIAGPFMVAYPQQFIRAGLCDGFYWKHIQQEGSFWRRDLWNKVGGLNRGMKYAGDWDLWRRFAEHAEPVHVDKATGCFRARAGQLSSRVDEYTAEIDAIVAPEGRRYAAAALADKLPDTRFQRFETAKGELVEETLTADCLPQQARDNYRDLAGQLASQPAKTVTTRYVRTDEPGTVRRVAKSIPGVPSVYRRFAKPLAEKIRHRRARSLIEKSGLFFRDYYISEYPDVAEGTLDPLDHFVAHGWREGRSPNPYFCETFYRNTYADIAANATVPGLAHYVRTGWRELRDPHPDFSTSFYLSSNPDVQESRVNPLWHFLVYGVPEGRSGSWHRQGDTLQAAFALQEEGEKGHHQVASDAVVRGETSQSVAAATATAETWLEDKEYSRRSHWPEFLETSRRFSASVPDPDDCDLKVYQDLLMATFIEHFVPKGARILEIGGGQSRILKHFARDYECWNLDKLEGLGNGPTTAAMKGVKLVRDYIGAFSNQLPADYFDFIFSISVLEHFPAGEEALYQACLDDIDRVARSGCQHLHLVDVVYHKPNSFVWAADVLQHWLEKRRGKAWPAIERRIMADPSAFFMSPDYFERTWRHTTGQTYEEFGSPANYTLAWKTPRAD